jgi:hypothetical protein
MKGLDILIDCFEVLKTDNDNLLDGISHAYKLTICQLIDNLSTSLF